MSRRPGTSLTNRAGRLAAASARRAPARSATSFGFAGSRSHPILSFAHEPKLGARTGPHKRERESQVRTARSDTHRVIVSPIARFLARLSVASAPRAIRSG